MKRVFVNEQWCLACHLCEYNCAYANSGLNDIRDKTPLDLVNLELLKTTPSLEAFPAEHRGKLLGKVV